MVRTVVPSCEAVVRWALDVLHVIVIAVGCILLLRGIAWAAIGSGLAFTRADAPSEAGPPRPPSGSENVFTPNWFRYTTERTLGYCLVPGKKLRGRVDGAALTVVLLTLAVLILLVLLMAGADIARPDDRCTYTHCWLLVWQGLTLALPFIAAVVVMGVMSCFADHIDAWVRRLIPAAIYFIGLILLVFVWDRWLFSFFSGPPPW